MPGGLEDSNFTDCPYAALQYSKGPGGVLLVIDLPDNGSVHVQEAIWTIKPDPTAPLRFLLRRAFDRHITAELPAVELRKRLRRPGYSKMSDRDRSRTLRYIVEQMVEERAPRTTVSETKRARRGLS